MRDVASHAYLVDQLLLPLGERTAGGEELECDRLAELQVVGAVHLAHPSLAQPGSDAVAVREDGARNELERDLLALREAAAVGVSSGASAESPLPQQRRDRQGTALRHGTPRGRPMGTKDGRIDSTLLDWHSAARAGAREAAQRRSS